MCRAVVYASNEGAPIRHRAPRFFQRPVRPARPLDTGEAPILRSACDCQASLLFGTEKVGPMFRLAGTAAAAVAILVAGGALAVNAYANEDGGRPLPSHVFSPYFQAYTDASPAEQSKASGARYLTMAFLQTEKTGSCDILWNGDPTKPVTRSVFGPDIAKIRARGGDVVPSFGGFSPDNNPSELAHRRPDRDQNAGPHLQGGTR